MQLRAAVIASVLLLGLTSVPVPPALAQESAAAGPASAPPSDADWRPSIGLPLPRIGLPLPTIGLPLGTSAPAASAPPSSPPSGLAPDARQHPGRAGRGSDRRGSVLVYPLPLFPASAGVAVPGTAAGAGTAVGAPTSSPIAGIGRLQFDVAPRQVLQVYVDGYYVGTPDDYPDGIELPAGPHALELRGPSLRAHAASVQIPAGRTITYRATLDVMPAAKPGESGDVTDAVQPAPHAAVSGASAAADPAAQTPSNAPSAAPFYLIPGCYLGNVPPDEHNTPPGCDRSQVRTQPR